MPLAKKYRELSGPEKLGILGSVASVIGLAIAFWPADPSLPTTMQKAIGDNSTQIGSVHGDVTINEQPKVFQNATEDSGTDQRFSEKQSGSIGLDQTPTQEQLEPIELYKLIEVFMLKRGSYPSWSMGADKSTPQISWLSSGVEMKPGCGSYESCRRGVARVLVNHEEIQHLRKRLEPVLWNVFIASYSLPKFGPEEVSLSPSCDTVQCAFDFKKSMAIKGFSLKKMCEAGPAYMRQTAYDVGRGTSRIYAVVNENEGSGGTSTDISLFFKLPETDIDLCSEARSFER